MAWLTNMATDTINFRKLNNLKKINPDAEMKQLVIYDDEESVKLKCEYIKEHNMAGVMFWQYASDPKGYLLTTIHSNR